MAGLKRQPGKWEYLDLQGRMRTSKKGLGIGESLNIQAAKQRRWEAKIARARVNPVFVKTGTGALPEFEIMLFGSPVGFMKRGHVLVGSFRKKGIFLKALGEMEREERVLFSQNWRFRIYKDLIVRKMELEKTGTAEMYRFIDELNTPTHVDYTPYTTTACGLLTAGYSLAPASMHELQRNGLRDGVNRKEIISFLKKHPGLSGKFLFLFTKPMELG